MLEVRLILLVFAILYKLLVAILCSRKIFTVYISIALQFCLLVSFTKSIINNVWLWLQITYLFGPFAWYCVLNDYIDTFLNNKINRLPTLLKVSHDGMSCEITKLMLTPRKKSSKPHDGKSLIIRQKFDKSTKIDKATKGE